MKGAGPSVPLGMTRWVRRIAVAPMRGVNLDSTLPRAYALG
jgi:hypothetical protein